MAISHYISMSLHISNNKRIVRNTGLLYVRQLFVLVLALYTSRLTLQVLGETDFGIYAAVGGITALLSVLINSMSGSTQRFLTFELGKGDIVRLCDIYSTAKIIHVAIAVLLFIFAETLGVWFFYNQMTIPAERLDVAFWVFQISVLTCMINISNVPNSAIVVAHEDMSMFAMLAIMDAVLKLCVVILLFVISWDKLLYYAVFLFLIQVANVTVYMVYVHRKYEEVTWRYTLDKSLLKSMSSFAGWTVVYNLSTTGFTQGVNLLLNLFFGPLLNAAYTIAMQAYSGIRSFCSSFQLAATPQIVKLYSSGEYQEMHKLIIRACKMSFFLIFCLSLPFLVNVDFVLGFWLKDVPAHTRNFFILLLVFAYFDVFAYPMDMAAQATGKIKHYNLTTSLFMIAALPVIYVAFSFGTIAESAYIVAIVMAMLGILVRIRFLARMIGLPFSQFFVKVFLRSFLTVVVSLTVVIIMNSIVPDGYWGIALYFFLSFLLSVATVYAIGLERAEKQFVLNIIHKIIRI